MSGTKLICLILCCLQVTFVSAVTWNIADDMFLFQKNDFQNFSNSPFSYPDSLSFAAAWLPLYHGFGVHEGMIYLGWPKGDISIKSQMHDLMSNHEITYGFPVLNEEHIKGGIQLHYQCSFLYNENIIHQGSISAGIALLPQNPWRISFYTMDMLHFPRNSDQALKEARIGLSIDLELFPNLVLSVDIQKYSALAWNAGISASISLFKFITIIPTYKIRSHEFGIKLNLEVRKWGIELGYSWHEYLGSMENIMVSYVP